MTASSAQAGIHQGRVRIQLHTCNIIVLLTQTVLLI